MNKAERAIVFPVTIGSLIEWYEVYLYIYWAPIIAKQFFDLSLPFEEFINFLIIIIVGLIAKPLGALVLGYVGDHKGRKKAFLLSIILIAIPSFLTAIMPSFGSWNIIVIIYLAIMKFIQGIPSGGEIPGAICFLRESAAPNRIRYLCSYTFVGPQIGQILSMLQCFLFAKYRCLSGYLSHNLIKI